MMLRVLLKLQYLMKCIFAISHSELKTEIQISQYLIRHKISNSNKMDKKTQCHVMSDSWYSTSTNFQLIVNHASSQDMRPSSIAICEKLPCNQRSQ